MKPRYRYNWATDQWIRSIPKASDSYNDEISHIFRDLFPGFNFILPVCIEYTQGTAEPIDTFKDSNE